MDQSNEPQQSNWAQNIMRMFWWNHEPMQKPIMPNISHLSAIPRTAAILKFRLHSLFYFADRSGRTREIIRFTLMGFLIGLPVLGLISVVMMILQKVFEVLMTIVGIIIVAVILLAFFKHN